MCFPSRNPLDHLERYLEKKSATPNVRVVRPKNAASDRINVARETQARQLASTERRMRELRTEISSLQEKSDAESQRKLESKKRELQDQRAHAAELKKIW